MDPKRQQQIAQLEQTLLKNKNVILNPQPNNPKWVEFARKLIQIAQALANQQLSPEAAQLVQHLLYETIAIPQVSGVKTTVQGNKWDSRTYARPLPNRRVAYRRIFGYC